LRFARLGFLLIVSPQHEASELLVTDKAKRNKLEEIFEIFVCKIPIFDALELAVLINAFGELFTVLRVIAL
jgi:hypothetical protein